MSAAGGQKQQFWANFDTFWGSCTDPLLPMRANLVSYSRPAVYAYLPNFVSIGLFCRPLAAKPPQFLSIFAIFWTSVFSVVASWQQSDKVEHGCTTTNLPLHGEIGRTISDNQKRDEQTDRQTNRQKNSTFLATPAAGEIRAPPNLAW